MEQTGRFDYKKPIIIAVGILALLALAYSIFYYKSSVIPKKEIAADTLAYTQSLLQGKPEALQDSLLNDIRNGTNDMFTKSSAYFVMHRYFDNGGNMYEIYDYVNNHPELAFLKEAEDIYPAISRQLETGRLPPSFGTRALYAYLAYSETLDKYGYSDVSTRATIANQYATSAYYFTKIPEDFKKGHPLLPLSEATENAIEKSILFATKARDDVTKILDGQLTQEDAPARDILVGLNQYASAVRFLDALGVTFDSPKDPREIFNFATDYSYRFVPELHLFTSWINASTLALSSSSTDQEIRTALYPILDYNTKNKPWGFLNFLIETRSQNYESIDIYGKTNVMNLANKVPELKAWLISNGWAETDFK